MESCSNVKIESLLKLNPIRKLALDEIFAALDSLNVRFLEILSRELGIELVVLEHFIEVP